MATPVRRERLLAMRTRSRVLATVDNVWVSNFIQTQPGYQT